MVVNTEAVTGSRAVGPAPFGHPVRRLILGSALMLILELALIRWLGANIVHLSYFTNFVLLGSFLGIGVGFLVSRKSWSLLPWTPVVLALLVLAVRLFPVSIDRAGADVIFFTSLDTTGPPAWLMLPVVRLGLAGRRRLRAPGRRLEALARGRRRRCHRRDARRRVGGARHLVVAVLQGVDPDGAGRGVRHPDLHLGQRGPAPVDVAGGVEAD
jgi:hypothetical protein